MKNFFFLLLLIVIPLNSFSQGIIITEIADPNDMYNRRYVEIFNSSSGSITLTDYYLIRYNNNSTSPEEATAISLATACGSTFQSKKFCILSNCVDTFRFGETFGIYSDNAQDNAGDHAANSDGNEKIAVVTSSGGSFDKDNFTTIDIFGTVGSGVGGVNTVENFENGRAERKSTVTNPQSTWNSAHWNTDNDDGTGDGAINTSVTVASGGFDPGYWIGATDVNTWRGEASTDWNTTTNWASSSVPVTDGIIWIRQIDGSDNIATVQTDGSTHTHTQLNIYSNGQLIISKDGKLTITGEITNDGTLTIQTDIDESGSLIAKAATNPTLTFSKTFSDGQWTLISPVVSGEIVNDIDNNLATNSGKSAIGYWDNTAGTPAWVNYNTGVSTTLTAGKGYQINRSGAGTVNFTGAMINSDQTAAITTESGVKGNWNLVGNPFPSYLHLNSNSDGSNNFITINSSKLDGSYQAAYAWDGSAYDTYNQSSGAMKIAPGEAFFVYAGGDDNVSFTEAMQVHEGGQGFIGRSNSKKDLDYKNAGLKIKMVDASKSTSYTKIYFNNNSTKGLDPGYDAGVFSSQGVSTRLVEEDKGIDLAIQSLAYSDMDDVVIPLGINAKAGDVGLVLLENTIPYDVGIYLEDKKNNTIVPFENAIQFTSSEDVSGTGRFFLHFKKEELDVNNLPSEIKIYATNDKSIMVEGLQRFEENPTLKLYGLNGELLKERVLNKENGTETVDVHELSRDIYIVNLNIGSQIINKKILIK